MYNTLKYSTARIGLSDIPNNMLAIPQAEATYIGDRTENSFTL